jgi:hypothetical protein
MRPRAYLVIAILGLTTALAAATAHAASILVNSALDPSDPPRCTLHDAIVAANMGVAVNGCKAGSGNDTISFSSGSKITLKATLPAIERTLQINGRPTQPKTVISGNNAVQIMVIDSSAVVSLSNLTLTNGVAGPVGIFVGGAALNNNGDVSINGCVIANSNLDTAGTAVLGSTIFNGGGLRLSNSSITNNVVTSTNGVLGTVYNSSTGPVTISNCKFIGNRNTSSGNGFALGAVNQSSSFPITVENSSFVENRATSSDGPAFGGAITQQNFGLVTVKNCTFTNNSVDSHSFEAFGGAIGNGGKNVEIDNSTFTGNSASTQAGAALGGGVGGNGQSLTISDSTFIGNSVFAGPGVSELAGGGAVGDDSTGSMSIINSTFYRNTASADMAANAFGGGVGSLGDDSVFFSTFRDNSATNNGGMALGGNFASNSTGLIANSIVARAGAGGNCGGSFTDGGYNISDDSSCAFSATGSRNNTNPNLATRPASNGGPTQTIALQHGSPAIDAIPHASCIDSNDNPVTGDQRGKPRPDRGDGPNGPCDIGAYEYQDPPFPP